MRAAIRGGPVEVSHHGLSTRQQVLRVASPSLIVLRWPGNVPRQQRHGHGGQPDITSRASATEAQQAADAAATAAAPYAPSPMDYSSLVPQLISMAFLFVCLGYYQFVLAPTAQVKFNLSDETKRNSVKEVLKDDSQPLKQWLYRLWLKPIARPRGDQTKGGTVIPGLTDPKPPTARTRKAAEDTNKSSGTGRKDDQ